MISYNNLSSSTLVKEVTWSSPSHVRKNVGGAVIRPKNLITQITNPNQTMSLSSIRKKGYLYKLPVKGLVKVKVLKTGVIYKGNLTMG